jgi:thioredoxin 2
MDATATKKVTVACPFCSRLNRVDLARAASGPKCGECGRPIRLDRPVGVDDATFDRLIVDAQVPVLVDFYADWCGPCKMVAPIMDALARDHMGQVLIAKVNTDYSPQLSRRFQIASIPTVMLFKDGKIVAQQLGALPRQGYEAMLAKAAAT